MEIIDNTLPVIAGAAAVAFCIGYFVSRKGRRNKSGAAAQAALAFRNKVLAELVGLYPVPRALSSGAYEKFRETIPGIQSAAAEFRSFVPHEKRGSFDSALKNYCEHCSEITWQSCATFGVISERSRPEDIGPKEIFRQNINALLSFAKERK
jgi:hypothetical protein